MLEIHEKSSDEDMSFFLRLSYWALKTLRKPTFEQIMKDHPDATDEEANEICAKETTEYMDFTDPKVKVFIASIDGERCGYLWIAPRNSEDSWDLERPQWIYDIVVDPSFQGRGIGRMLMRRGEEYAVGLPCNIGLFVHSDNARAVALYEKMEYTIKAIPVSKKVVDTELEKEDESIITREMEDLPPFIREVEYNRFRKMVLFSSNATEKVVQERFVYHLERNDRILGKYRRFAAFTHDDRFAGSVWVGPSGFSENVAQIHGFVLEESERGQETASFLVSQAEEWAKNEGYSTLYVLLHSKSDLNLEVLRARGYAVPGFFMEKRLI